MTPQPPSAASLELTAISLEALSLSPTLPPPPTSATLPPHPQTPLEALPLNIPTPRALPAPLPHVHVLLRRLLHHLHDALHPPSALLPSALLAVRALALSAPAHRHLLASLGLVRLLLPALPPLLSHPTLGPLLCSTARAALDGPAAALACAHFAAARPARPILAAWRALPAPRDPHLVADLAHCFAAAAHALPPSAVDALAAPSALTLLAEALEAAVFDARPHLAIAVLRLAAAVVATSGDPARDGGRRSLVQVRVRELHLIDAALACLARFPHNVPVAAASITFLKDAVTGHVQNVVELGTARDTQGLQLVLACFDPHALHLPADHHPADIPNLSAALVDLCAELCRVRANLETLLSLDLTSRLVRILPTVVVSAPHAATALRLLERCVRASAAEAARVNAPAVVAGMVASRASPDAQTAGIAVLVALVERGDDVRDFSCRSGAVQAVHYALTEHSRDPAVVAQASLLLIRLSPVNIVEHGLPLPELRKVVRSRYRAHRDNSQATAALEDLSQALELVSNRTARLLMESAAVSTEELDKFGGSGGIAASPHKRLLPPRGPVSGSFRVSFHRKGKNKNKHGVGSAAPDMRPRRRVRSDFTAETTFGKSQQSGEEVYLDDATQNSNDKSTQSFRLKSLRLRERSWLNSLATVLPGDGGGTGPDQAKVGSNVGKGEEDRTAVDPLIDTLARSREQRSNLDDVSSSQSSSHSGAGRLVTSMERLPNEMRLTLPKLRPGKSPVVVVQRKLKTTEAQTSWLAGQKAAAGTVKQEEQVGSVHRLVDNKRETMGIGRRLSEMMPVGRMSFDAVDSNSGMSEADVGEEDSLLSFSDSDVDSLEDGSWCMQRGSVMYEEGHAGAKDMLGAGCTASSREAIDDLEGSTISPQPPREGGSPRSSGVGEGGRKAARLRERVDSGSSLDAAEQFPELDEGNTDSLSSQPVVSVVTDDGRGDLISQSHKYGERERSDDKRVSGSWGPPMGSIWKLMPIDNAADASLRNRNGAAWNAPAPARGESGSLIARR